MRLRLPTLSRDEWLRLSGFGGAVAFLHLLGWGLFLWYARSNPALAGLGTLAYTFGLRHAFDADHIAAIDNTTRKMLQQGKRPLGVGFFFSLGHSTIVFGLVAGLAAAAASVKSNISALQSYGGYVGASVSGTFLWIIGILNLLVLIDILRIFREMKSGRYDKERLEQRLLDRGLMSRLFIGRVANRIRKSWQMYPLGVLFGLGFDTATEVALIAISVGVGVSSAVPIWMILILPLMFTCGMVLVDTSDGVVMRSAYGWAFVNPIRKVYYNLTVTIVSVIVAFGIGGIEILSLLAPRVGLTGPFWDSLADLNFETMGVAIIVLFVVAWTVSVAYWKYKRFDERFASSDRT